MSTLGSPIARQAAGGGGVITLHHSPASAHSASVRIVLAEKQLDCALHELDLARSEQHRPAFLAVNPTGMVPVLEDGGHRLTQVFFILPT